MKKGVLGNFTKFTGKHLCQSLAFNKVAGLIIGVSWNHPCKTHGKTRLNDFLSVRQKSLDDLAILKISKRIQG